MGFEDEVEQFTTALPSNERQVQADSRSHLIYRPARGIIPPLGEARVSLLPDLVLRDFHAAAAACSRVLAPRSSTGSLRTSLLGSHPKSRACRYQRRNGARSRRTDKREHVRI